MVIHLKMSTGNLPYDLRATNCDIDTHDSIDMIRLMRSRCEKLRETCSVAAKWRPQMSMAVEVLMQAMRRTVQVESQTAFTVTAW